MDNEDNVLITHEDFAYGFIIEVLTGGLYPNKFHVIREYVQNSFDAICKWRKDPNFDQDGCVEIKFINNSIIIYDTGTGMDKAKVNQYRYVGYSEKKISEATGFRGIGKLSGISVAERIIVTSSMHGSSERYKLVFDAQGMILEIIDLKTKGENIPLTELIKKYTDVAKEVEEKGLHYTIVELNNIRSDSTSLLNEENLISFLGKNVPVSFDPTFAYGEEIHRKISERIDDYEIVDIKVNGTVVYKPYIDSCYPPEYEFVWDDGDGGEEQSPIAFCWYCQNKESSQFEDKDKSGLLFKLKNFTIGDKFLTREKLFISTPERAFWFFGEVYINDSTVVPTSERNNFVQNEGRDRLYRKGSEIGKTLSRIAGKFSEENRALQKLDETDSILQQVEREYEEGKISSDIKLEKVVTAYKAFEEIEKRFNKLPTEAHKQKGRDLIKKGKDLVGKIEQTNNTEGNNSKIYDITKELSLNSQAIKVYKAIINILKDVLSDNSTLYEDLINKIHNRLREKLK